MAIQDELNTRLKAAMRARDQRTLDVIRMIKSRIKEQETAAGFTGEVDDKMVVGVIQTYVKQMKKALEDYRKAGAKGQDSVDQLEFEIAYLEPFLPQMLDADATRPIVEAAIASLGIDDPRQAGRVVGHVMKGHRGKVDPAVVKRIAAEILGG